MPIHITTIFFNIRYADRKDFYYLFSTTGCKPEESTPTCNDEYEHVPTQFILTTAQLVQLPKSVITVYFLA